ncbi:MAG: serine/threonine-protein kinase [Gemmatimonadota bacterium]
MSPRLEATELAPRLQAAVQGEFVVGRLLGQGGFALVFQAREESLGRDVAIKVLDPNLAFSSEHSERFLTEARLIAALEHPHIVPIYQVEQKGGLLYIVMRFVPGTSLGGVLASQGKLPPARVASIAREVADALDHAHRHQVIHRDIKPDNILLDDSGHAVVTDFGISRAARAAHLTQEGMVVGTPAYMSPEQASGEEIDGRSDVYALGVVMYEMLTGQPPFGGKTAAQVLAKHLSQQPPELGQTSPETPEVLATIVARALAKDPGERYPTARAMAEALAATSAPGALESGSVQRRRRLGKRVKWAGALVGVVVLLLIAFVVGAVTLVRSMFKSEPPALSLIAPNIPEQFAALARTRFQIPAADSVLYLFVAHGRPETDGLAISNRELIRADSAGIRRLPWGDLNINLNSQLTQGSGSMMVKDKGSTRVDTVLRGLTTREIAAIGEALSKLKGSSDSK